MHTTETLAEADRLMTVCNSCRYCESLCAVFPAMELRRSFADGDLNYLANLCHGCAACFTDCQFSPPHEFNVNVPKTLAQVRADSWRSYAWPAALRPIFDRNGLAITIAAALSVAGFFVGFRAWSDPQSLWASDGEFYRLMPHRAMAGLFGAVSLYALIAMIMGLRNFWSDTGNVSLARDDTTSLFTALKDSLSLRYLDGGGVGCFNADDRPHDLRRVCHHFTFYGFMLCFAATVTGTFYHYLLDLPAPYGLFELPKLFGIAGGIGLVIGTSGLLHARYARDPALTDKARFGMDAGFTIMLFLAALSGLILMMVRQTPWLAIALSAHLGAVFALFLSMPYGRFVHGLYRVAALLRYAMERRRERPLSQNQ